MPNKRRNATFSVVGLSSSPHQLNEQINCRIVFAAHRTVHLSGQQSEQQRSSILNFDTDPQLVCCKNDDGGRVAKDLRRWKSRNNVKLPFPPHLYCPCRYCYKVRMSRAVTTQLSPASPQLCIQKILVNIVINVTARLRITNNITTSDTSCHLGHGAAAQNVTKHPHK